MGLSSCFWPLSSCHQSLTVNGAYRASQMLLFILIVVKAYSPLPHQGFCLVSQNMPTVSQTYRSWALATAHIDSSFPNILDAEPTLCSYPGTWHLARCWASLMKQMLGKGLYVWGASPGLLPQSSNTEENPKGCLLSPMAGLPHAFQRRVIAIITVPGPCWHFPYKN